MATLVAATDKVADPDDLGAVLRAIATTTLAHRAHGSLYRWEARFLEPDDRQQLRATTRRLRASVSVPLRRQRPEVGERDASLLAAAALAVVASVSAHRVVTRDLADVVTGLALSVLGTRLPPAPVSRLEEEPATVLPWQSGLEPTSKRERLVTEAVKAFERHGYLGATLEEIGGAVGLSASAVYRYVPTKAALLAAAFARTQVQLSAVTAAALADATSGEEALDALASAYVLLWFQQPAVMTVWGSEAGHLRDDERDELRAAQRDHVELWVRVTQALDPRLDPVAARVRVHAALTVVADTGRLLRFDGRPQVRARVVALVRSVLLPTP
ncbi:MAG: TetR/AcrR family transcriptional regulator [Actinomycetota bacterium]|nr:TetR/AcrR family transcriptional regulator [Actinomycetota bacterium]